jgi:hypothetical protein
MYKTKRGGIMTKIYKIITGEILFESDSLSMKELVEKHKKWLRGANLRDANLYEADLRDANLYEADLRYANLYRADLWRANLMEADLRGADLEGANLRGADLRDANLGEADLEGADLRNADLRNADLWRANLMEAKLMDAKIGGATILNYKEIGGIGNSKRLLRCFLLNNDSFYFMAGCFSGTEQELKEKVIDKYGADCEYIEAIEYLKNLCIKYKGE